MTSEFNQNYDMSNRFGMSLNVEYLSGDTSRPEQALFGSPDNLLSALAGRGIGAIELHIVGANTDTTLARRALSVVLEHGMRVTVHGALPAPSEKRPVAEALPALWAVLHDLKFVQDSVTVVVHAYNDYDKLRSETELAQASVLALRDLSESFRNTGLLVDIALENNRAQDRHDPSATFAGVIDMCRQANDPSLGVCWDFGHGHASHLIGCGEQIPPEEFIKKVRQTHIHDIGAAGRTHWPLTEQRLPLRKLITELAMSGYGGIWNLEISPARFHDEPDAAQRYLDSIFLLRTAVAEVVK